MIPEEGHPGEFKAATMAAKTIATKKIKIKTTLLKQGIEWMSIVVPLAARNMFMTGHHYSTS